METNNILKFDAKELKIRRRHAFLVSEGDLEKKDIDEAYEEILDMKFNDIKWAIKLLKNMGTEKSKALVSKIEVTESIRTRLLISDEG